jgi:hypothetical protein
MTLASLAPQAPPSLRSCQTGRMGGHQPAAQRRAPANPSPKALEPTPL